ncbi:protein of unknown function [Pseudorhizobium banfieldiae]|uniref:Uncharacterized protein n=1 Tax=Pseudorhizobium banfieldiae TaxID=1125847 RepID=L0NM30_9HYPH|nr:hypothetical protein [Pseudorhizobium banfieldiae]CAD6596693.1 hypothetical protein RNT25_00358 [arsenite-oxidising bacterium NT-25]CCF21969.1 protein of unknown function [Pseudorhizobium banfieldiae]
MTLVNVDKQHGDGFSVKADTAYRNLQMMKGPRLRLSGPRLVSTRVRLPLS